MDKPFEHDIVLKSRFFEVGQDWEVPIPGFYIISPVRKLRSISEFSDEELIEFSFLTRKIRSALADVLNIKDVYLFQNEDTKHGFHLWIFPRYEWMEKFDRKIESVRPIMEYAKLNMFDEQNVKSVRAAVAAVKVYLSNIDSSNFP